jgi:hypothetical protein
MKDIAKAAKLLKDSGISPKAIPPVALVATANQLNKSLEQTLNLIAYLKSGGQGYSQFPQTAKLLTGEYE